MRKFLILSVFLFGQVSLVHAEPFIADIFEAEPPHAKILQLERIDKKEGDVDLAIGEIKDTAGKLIYRDETRLRAGKILSYDLNQVAMEETGRVEVKENQVWMQYTRDGKTKDATDDLEPHFAVPGTVVDYLVSQWDKLAAGEAVQTRLVAMDRRELVTFQFKLEKIEGDRMVIKMAPKSPFIKMFVKDMFFKFDTKSRRVMEFQGMLAVKKRDGNSWNDWYGRLEYRYPSSKPGRNSAKK